LEKMQNGCPTEDKLISTRKSAVLYTV